MSLKTVPVLIPSQSWDGNLVILAPDITAVSGLEWEPIQVNGICWPLGLTFLFFEGGDSAWLTSLYQQGWLIPVVDIITFYVFGFFQQMYIVHFPCAWLHDEF